LRALYDLGVLELVEDVEGEPYRLSDFGAHLLERERANNS
jgi:hypothetical protein